MRRAEQERCANGERGLAACEQLFALDVELRVECVVLCVMLELSERRKRPRWISEHDTAHARLLRERHADAPEFFIHREFPSVEPHDCVLHRLGFFIEHREQIPAGARLLHDLPLPGAHERAAAAPAADELNHPRAAPSFQLGKLERLPVAFERPAVESLRAFAVRHEAVEIEVGVELAALREEKVERVHLVDFHDELRRVLRDHVELHIVARLEKLRVRFRKLDVHALSQCLKYLRRE